MRNIVRGGGNGTGNGTGRTRNDSRECLIHVANKMHYYKTFGKRSTSPQLFIGLLILT
jgi:hypothetical protein